MTLDGKLLARARQRLAQRKADNEAEQLARQTKLWAAVPELRRIDAQLHGLLGEVLEATAGGANAAEALTRARERSEALCREKALALTSRGYPADYLDPIESCSLCHDSGYLEDGTICRCLTALYEEEKAKVVRAYEKQNKKKRRK